MLEKYIDLELLQYIVDNKLRAGDRLPPLTELSERLNISVSKLREQLAVARSLDLVGVKPGAGMQINDYNFAATIQMSLSYGLLVCEQNFATYTALRNATTAAFWVEAVRLLTPEDLVEIRALLTAAWDKLKGQPIQIPHREHQTFHLTLFKHLDNPFVIGIEAAYWFAYEAVELNRYVDYQYLKMVWEHHEKMVDFIEKEQFEESKDIFIKHTQLLKVNTEVI